MDDAAETANVAAGPHASEPAILLRDARRGILAGLIGGTFQVAIGWLLQALLLPDDEDNNIAPRLISRTFGSFGLHPHGPRDWLFGTLFHFGYGAAWGIAMARGRTLGRIPALLVAAPTSLLIYLAAFSRVGAGTILRAESHPEERHPQKQRSLLGVVLAFTLSAGAALDYLGRHDTGITLRPLPHSPARDDADPDAWL